MFVLFVACGALACAEPASAPQENGVSLTDAFETLPVPGSFSWPTSAIAVGDRMLVVADRREASVSRVSWADTTPPVSLGAIGDGPGEFRFVGDLFRWRGDSVALFDYPNPLVVLSAADGRGRSFDPWQELSRLPRADGARVWAWFPDMTAGDGRGGLIGAKESRFDGRASYSLDSAIVLRFVPDAFTLDTLATYAPGDDWGPIGDGSQELAQLRGYAIGNRWAFIGGDTVAVIDAADYRVRVIVRRREVAAFTLPFTPVRVDRARWRRTADSASDAWARYTNSQRGRPGLPSSPTDAPRLVYPEPPPTLPPVRYDGRGGPLPLAGRRLFVPVADPDGTDGFEPWEIVDLDAACRLGRVLLRPSERIIGADAGGVIIARRDSLDLHTLVRVTIPDGAWRGPAATCGVEAGSR